MRGQTSCTLVLPLVRRARHGLAALALALLTSACSTLPAPSSGPAPAPGPVAADSAPKADPLGALITQTAQTPASAGTIDDTKAPAASTPAAAPGSADARPADALGALIEQTQQPRGTPTAPPPAPRPPPPQHAESATPGAQAAIGSAQVPGVVETARAPQVGDVWDRIRRGFAIPDLETRLAAQRTQWYASQPDYMDRMAQRASRYLFHIVEEIEKRGMPTELALLPFVESAMQPEAVSSAKAAGLWQFIPSTGKLYALEQNLWHDQRRDIVESTRAALDYLQKLYGDFGDWHLALAAYNWGEGAVGRAIARNRAQRKPTDYTSLRMPNETAHYVPKLQAIKNIVRDPAKYGITLPAIRNEPYFVAVSKMRDIDVETAARLAEMPIDEFRSLNPSFNRPVIIGAAQPTILLPADRAETFSANLAAFESTGQPLASWAVYTLAKNETLAQVAKRADISEAKLREANRIPPRYRLAPGSVILIPRDESMDEDISADHLAASFSLVPEGSNLRQVTYKVRRGDTLNSVARRWNVQPDEITAWNNLRTPTLFAGQRLTLTVARAPAKAAASGKNHARPATRAGARPASKAAAPASRGGARPATKANAKPTVHRATPTAHRPGRDVSHGKSSGSQRNGSAPARAAVH